MKHVYIIEAGNGHKKIGVAKDVKMRINQLKTGISTGIKSIHVSEKIENPFDIEDKLHKANEHLKLHGEWFAGDLDYCGIDFKDIEGNNLISDNYHSINTSNIVSVLREISSNALKLFFVFIESIDNNNQVVTDVCFKDKASDKILVSVRTIDNLITELVKLNLIKRRVQNIYIINKNIVTYGRSIKS